VSSHPNNSPSARISLSREHRKSGWTAIFGRGTDMVFVPLGTFFRASNTEIASGLCADFAQIWSQLRDSSVNATRFSDSFFLSYQSRLGVIPRSTDLDMHDIDHLNYQPFTGIEGCKYPQVTVSGHSLTYRINRVALRFRAWVSGNRLNFMGFFRVYFLNLNQIVISAGR